MIYITGDTHGYFNKLDGFKKRLNLTDKDVVVILGDAGFNYDQNYMDVNRKKFVSKYPFTTFCIHGNHELRPATLKNYKTKEYHGGLVWYEEEYPNILFAKDGEVYDFDGISCLVIGGAYSVDKYYRLRTGSKWFEDEQPSPAIKEAVEKTIAARHNKVDVVFSHTCPRKYEPREAFLPTLDQALIDKSTEDWLDKIEDKLDYKRWYCGHYHIEKDVGRVLFLFNTAVALSDDLQFVKDRAELENFSLSK